MIWFTVLAVRLFALITYYDFACVYAWWYGIFDYLLGLFGFRPRCDIVGVTVGLVWMPMFGLV